MKVKLFREKWLNLCILATTFLYCANYFVTPEIVGVTKLEQFFRPKRATPFDSNNWKAASPTSGERFKMVDELLKRRILQGRSRREIVELLGSPSIGTPANGIEVQMLYPLASQKDYPAHSFWFPGRLHNLEVWILLLRFREGRVYLAEVIAT
jgi:hypothetical protein